VKSRPKSRDSHFVPSSWYARVGPAGGNVTARCGPAVTCSAADLPVPAPFSQQQVWASGGLELAKIAGVLLGKDLNSVVRRALAMAAGEQYVRLAVQFLLIVVVSRLLTPTEIGVSVIGTGIVTIALGLREFATSDFLIQRGEVERDDIRTAFTLALLLTALITAAMFALAPWFGTFYGEEKLARFVRIAAVAGLIEAVALPIRGLLRREMEFGTLALINTASAATTAVVTILLALAGFSYMSVAWAMLAAACTTTILSFCFRPDLSFLRPAFKSCGSVLTFGAYNGASFVINRTYEALPQLVLGHMLPHSAVGVYNRAQMVSDIPDRIVLTSVFSIAFPALAAEIRNGHSLKEPYLRALGYITVVYWPPLILLALLAYPIVALLLGPQWSSVAPLLQVMAIAGLAWFPVVLTSPVLLAVGANRDRVLADLLGRSVSAVVLCAAASFGIMAMAASKLVTLPFQMIVSFCYVRRHIDFQWGELGVAVGKSAVVTIGSAAGPACVVALSGAGFDLSQGTTALAALLAVTGWLATALATQHPILLELRTAAAAFATTSFARRCSGLRKRIIALSPRARESG
jgi:O-antigen/teichoic acid export membrane protein